VGKLNQFWENPISTKHLVWAGVLVGLCSSIARGIWSFNISYHLSKEPYFLSLYKQSGSMSLVEIIKNSLLFSLIIFLTECLPALIAIWSLRDYLRAQLILLFLLICLCALNFINVFIKHYLIYNPWENMQFMLGIWLLGISVMCTLFSVIRRDINRRKANNEKKQ
jgi:hypothetical protein